jgi:hypothetical protein
MNTLKKGDCEHCGRFYRYSLWNSGFANNSYAYCSDCGLLAIFNCSSPVMAGLPKSTVENEEIDQSWEAFLLPCPCGGRFRKGASPRCPTCNEPLSAEHAAGHIQAQAFGSGRGWMWQNNWSGAHCMAMEDPANPGSMLQIEDPVGTPKAKARKRWWVPFRLGSQETKELEEAATTKSV